MQLTHWDVAIDLTERSHGALRFAQALQHACGVHAIRLTAVHVVETGLGARTYPGLGSVAERATASVRASAKALGVADVLSDVVVAEHDHAEQWLADRPNVDGLIIGRAADSEGWSLVSLGRVARRLLRSLSAPTFVVPPDFSGSIRPGPIVAALADDDRFDDVVDATDRFGARLGRARVAVRALPPVRMAPPSMATAMAGPPIPSMVEDPARVETSLLRLSANLGTRMERFDLRCMVGAPQSVVMAVAQEVDAAFIVCGSGNRGLLASVIDPDVGGSLAAAARRPVLLLPSQGDETASNSE